MSATMRGGPSRPGFQLSVGTLGGVCAVLLGAVLAVRELPAQGLALDISGEATGLVQPVAMAAPNDGSGRLFIVQQTGEILIRDSGGTLLAAPFLDLSTRVTCCGERGLLGLAFHPDYATNGELFVDYTRTVDSQLQTVVARYTVSEADPDAADPSSEEIVLVIDQPRANHNGGQLAFGPDGFLYIAAGDGGGAGDPEENAQALDTLLGAILRLDVDGTQPPLAYSIPPDNPFVGVAGARDEIWAYGLRNPWRFSFDRETGDLWIADVGQQDWEEVDLQPVESPGGENYGWDCREGAHDYDDPNGDHNATCPADPETAFVDPVLEYFQEDGRCSVTGGFRYRGSTVPRLRGVYLYADFCTGEIFGTVPRCDGVIESRRLLDAPFLITAFGEDAAGELYVTEYVTGDPAPPDSKIHRLGLAPGSDGPDLASSPDPIDFGEVEVGDTVEAVLTLANTNEGPEAASVASSVLSDPARFAVDPRRGSAPCRALRPCLPPGASCTLGVALQAPSTGAIAESLTHEGNFATELVQLTADIVPCSSEVDLTLTDYSFEESEETERACDTLTAGSGVVVPSEHRLILRAGTRLVLADGFRVDEGGALTLEIF